ncbi:MAG: heat-shock protein Hsp20 [Dehalococcoidia bacterium]|nr:heat-shock protein Hsp20 [Dehalococcoidia bacterium]HCV00911.1 heat-shock protein Hsp20 [Dehalococcoidia bacterium]|tara:strand:+ start:655 stop:1086 length:432 start_codon:yes stop_codon:yes gene_type:complete
MASFVRYDPFGPPNDLVERFFNRALGSKELTGFDEGALGVDISETDNELVVRASLPGFSEDEIDVELHQGVLSIKAEHRSSEANEEERYHRRERRWSTLSRRLALPGMLHDANVNAELRNGVLTLRIPVPAKAKPRQIKIAAA